MGTICICTAISQPPGLQLRGRIVEAAIQHVAVDLKAGAAGPLLEILMCPNLGRYATKHWRYL